MEDKTAAVDPIHFTGVLSGNRTNVVSKRLLYIANPSNASEIPVYYLRQGFWSIILIKLLLKPLSMENAFLIYTLVCVRTKVIALCLYQICWQRICTITVIVR